MFDFFQGLSLDQYFREMIIWALSIGDYPWGTFYQELSLGYFLPRDYPFKELSFGYFPLGLILLGNYPWVSFYQGLSLGTLSFSPPIKGVGGPCEGLHYGGRWIMTACSDVPQQISLSLLTHTRWVYARSSHKVCAWLGNEGRGRQGWTIVDNSFIA